MNLNTVLVTIIVILSILLIIAIGVIISLVKIVKSNNNAKQQVRWYNITSHH